MNRLPPASSWDLLAEIEERLAIGGQSDVIPLSVRLVHATHHEALMSHETLQAEDARKAKRERDAERHAIFDAAIIRAAGDTKLEPTRKYADALQAVVHAELLEMNYTDKPPSWATIMRRIAKILEDQNNLKA